MAIHNKERQLVSHITPYSWRCSASCTGRFRSRRCSHTIELVSTRRRRFFLACTFAPPFSSNNIPLLAGGPQRYLELVPIDVESRKEEEEEIIIWQWKITYNNNTPPHCV
jgi:hypothetical protein